MITINDLHPDALRFEGLSEAEATALLNATGDMVPKDRVTTGPGFVAFDRLSRDEAGRVMATFRRVQGAPRV
jgi:hypothetical protein